MVVIAKVQNRAFNYFLADEMKLPENSIIVKTVKIISCIKNLLRLMHVFQAGLPGFGVVFWLIEEK